MTRPWLSPALVGFALGAGTLFGCAGPAPRPPGEGARHEEIVGGYVDKSTSGVVGLAFDIPGHFFVGHCSGSLIAPNLVLTARHCVSLDAQDSRVDCSATQLTVPGDGNMYLASPATIRPTTPTDPSFRRGLEVRVPPGSEELCGHDVALIILEGAGIPANAAKPIVPRIDIPAGPDEIFSAEGYGLTDATSTTTDGVRMRLDDNSVQCAGLDCPMVGDVVRGTEWASNDAYVCPGDSGGPALDEQGRVFGVVSRGPDGCLGAIYSDVSAWKDFIITTALDAAELGGYAAPFWTKGDSTPPPVTAGVDGGTTPLGQECESTCEGGYACYTDTGAPPGICVPRCPSDGGECPSGYACADKLDVCVPEGSAALASSDEGGCHVRGGALGGSRSSASLVLGLLALVVGRRRFRGASG